MCGKIKIIRKFLLKIIRKMAHCFSKKAKKKIEMRKKKLRRQNKKFYLFFFGLCIHQSSCAFALRLAKNIFIFIITY